jgi:hypothetical protein
MGIRLLVLTSGYVEDASMAPLFFVFEGEQEFATVREALTDLAHALLDKYQIDQNRDDPRFRWCCRQTKLKNPAATHCTGATFCKQSLTPRGVYFDAFESWIWELHGKTAGSWGAADTGLWWPWVDFYDALGMVKSSAVIFEKAEKWLTLSIDPARLEDPEKATYATWFETNGKHYDWNDFALSAKIGSDPENFNG